MPRARALDGAVVLCVVLLLWSCITVGHEVRRLAGLGDTAGQLGTAVTAVGRAVGDIPVIGGQVGGAVQNAGRDATASAREARDDTHRLAILLGLVVALVPTLPLLLAYLPGRLAVERDRRALRRALSGADAEATRELLALRAIAHLPLHELQRLSPD